MQVLAIILPKHERQVNPFIKNRIHSQKTPQPHISPTAWAGARHHNTIEIVPTIEYRLYYNDSQQTSYDIDFNVSFPSVFPSAPTIRTDTSFVLC